MIGIRDLRFFFLGKITLKMLKELFYTEINMLSKLNVKTANKNCKRRKLIASRNSIHYAAHMEIKRNMKKSFNRAWCIKSWKKSINKHVTAKMELTYLLGKVLKISRKRGKRPCFFRILVSISRVVVSQLWGSGIFECHVFTCNFCKLCFVLPLI